MAVYGMEGVGYAPMVVAKIRAVGSEVIGGPKKADAQKPLWQ